VKLTLGASNKKIPQNLNSKHAPSTQFFQDRRRFSLFAATILGERTKNFSKNVKLLKHANCLG